MLLGFVSVALASRNKYVAEVRQNLNEKCNSRLVDQMTAFQKASLVYMAYASHFGRADVNLPGFRQFFLASSNAALRDSQKVLDYINLRGGHQQFHELDMKDACTMMEVPADLDDDFPDQTPQICHSVLMKHPSLSHKKVSKKRKFTATLASKAGQSTLEVWQHGIMGLSDALLMERTLNGYLIHLVETASLYKDAHLRHVVEDSFVTHQTERIKKLADLINRLTLYSEQDYPLGEYVMDLDMAN